MLDLGQFAEFAGPMGLLCILIILFGEVRRHVHNQPGSDTILGGIFGGVALLEMAIPITPFEGVIIDLRTIPIMLAGAFLNWRGLAVTLAMTATARMYMGGTGATAGVLSILIAGYAGAFWAMFTRNAQPRGLWHLALLGPLSGASFLGLLLLPRDMSFWFMQNAVPPLWGCYMLSLPLLGILIQRELLRSEETVRLRACTLTCPKSGLLRPASFLRKTMQLAISGPPGTVAGVLLVTPILPPRLRFFWGSSLALRAQSATATALTGRLIHTEYIGTTEQGQVIVPLTRHEMETLGPDADLLSRAVKNLCVALDGGPTFRLQTTVEVLSLPDPADLPDMLGHLNHGGAGSSFAMPSGRGNQSDPLFRKLEASLCMPRG